jgi:hypothetical protein
VKQQQPKGNTAGWLLPDEKSLQDESGSRTKASQPKMEAPIFGA